MALILLCLGCQRDVSTAPEQGGAPVSGDTFIFASIGEPNTLLPVLASDSASSAINGFVYSGLLRYDKNYVPEGELAESWEISEDNLTITFKLRRGVTWHDGAPFTSADVMFTYQLYVDPETPTSYAEDYEQVAHAETPDDYTFRVTYKEPYAPALMSWAVAIHPKHLLEGDKITESKLARQPIGTGPYIFKRWDAREKLVLEVNPDYFEGPAHVKRIVYRIIPDQTTMFLELKSGSLDYMGLTPLQYDRQTDTLAFKRRYNRFRYLDFGYTYLGYNLRRPLFQDKRVRQALSYAIDKQEIVDGVLLGYGQAATGPYKPGSWVYNDAVKRYNHDPEKALQLLAEAGWQDRDGDGLLDKDGQPFRFTVLTNQGNDLRSKTAEIIQHRLKKLGIDMKIRILEWASFLNEFVFPGNFDAVILAWTGGPDPDQYSLWCSTAADLERPLNFINFRHPEVDALLERGRRTFDRSEQKRVYDRFQEILAEEQPYTFLYMAESLPVVAKRFRGIEQAPAGIFYNFNDWYVPEQEQKYAR